MKRNADSGNAPIEIEVLKDPDAVALRAAQVIAEEARQSAQARGRFVWATSGGHTPHRMHRALVGMDVSWGSVQVFQVDERVTDASDPERNFSQLSESLLDHVPIPRAGVHPMPVEAKDLDAACLAYAEEIRAAAGVPVVFDLIHLGLGDDGHTASLVPQDPAGDVVDLEVTTTSRPYKGYRRMTLTHPVLARSRKILWVVTGAQKAAILARLLDGDRSIPAGRVPTAHALLLTDQAAALESLR